MVRLNAVFCETSKFTVHARSQDSKVPARMYSMYSFSIFLLRKRDPKNVMHKYISEVYSRVHFPVSTPQFVHISASTQNKLSDLNAITGEESPKCKSTTGGWQHFWLIYSGTASTSGSTSRSTTLLKIASINIFSSVMRLYQANNFQCCPRAFGNYWKLLALAHHLINSL